MKLTKKLEKEIREVYNTYWDGYMRGDMDAFSIILDEDVKVIGSTETEVFFNKQEALSFYLPTADQIAGKAELRNRIITIETAGNLVLVTEQNDFYILIEDNWTFYAKGRLTTFFHKKDGSWKIIQQHGSMPDIRAVEGEQFALEKISKENLELRDAVKRRTTELEQKNRDLEIEASLERVRTVAMGMNKADDMLDVCRIISEQMDLLGTADIRNVQTAIFYPEKKVYRNYEYYRRHEKSMVTDVDYTTDKRSSTFSAKMQAGAGEFFTDGITGKAVQDWYEFQKTTAQFPDSYLETATSLTYYWFALGPVALGCSSYTPLTEDEISLFKRFRNVFELAYRRFLDIQQAAEQAREAQVQLSLERVRGRAMAMHHSDEISEVLSVLFDQFDVLGITPMYTFLSLIDLEKNSFTYRQTGRGGKRVIAEQIIDLNAMDVWKGVLESWKAAKYDVVETMYVPKESVPEVFEVYKEIYSALPEGAKVYPEDFPDGMYATIAASKFGHLGYDHFRASTDEEKTILLRFNTEFVTLYQRFLDLQKAEAQTREAQIQLSLERVRGRAMAMHNSDELSEVLSLLFDQFDVLGIFPSHATISLLDLEKNSFTFRMTGKSGKRAVAEQVVSLDALKMWKDTVEQLKNAGSVQVYLNEYPKEVLPRLWELVSEVVAAIPEDARPLPEDFPNGMYEAVGIYRLNNNATYGTISFCHNRKATDEEKDIVGRFATEFGRLYQRFLDLKKAEAQAREAQIETSLERIRSRAIGIRKSSELMDIIHTVFGEWKRLGLELYESNINLLDRNTRVWTNWGTGMGDATLPKSYNLAWFDHPFLNQQYDDIVSGFPYREFILEGDDHRRFLHHLFTETDFKNSPKEYHDALFSIDKLYLAHAYMKYGSVDMVGAEPLPDAAADILKRFAKVFEQAYTRYLDVAQAEAQAREAQIEAALEKVRSRTMSMQRSDELRQVIQIVHEQLLQLNFNIHSANFALDYRESDHFNLWLSTKNQLYPTSVHIPYADHPIFQSFIEAKANNQDFYANHFTKEVKDDFFKHFFKYAPDIPEEAKEEIYRHEGYAQSTVLLKNISLGIQSFSGIPFTDEENATLMRFGRVFEQTYTRFNDLKQAETQTRESQIELGLERVRARAMAMQKSDELKELIGTVFTELTKLDLVLTRCVIMIFDPTTSDSKWWMANSEAPSDPIGLVVQYHEHPPYLAYLKAWKEKQIKYEYVLAGKMKNEWDDFLFGETELSSLPDHVIAGMKAPDKVHLNASFNSFGNLTLAALEPLSVEHFDIMLRFAKVFDLTYTRFNDLQKAEAQTRQAQIETAMEKVRARALAMQKPDELIEVAQLLRKEMGLLGVEELETSSIYIRDELSGKTECWYAIKQNQGPESKLVSDHFILNLEDTWVGRQMNAFYLSEEKQISIPMQGSNRKEWIEYCTKQSNVIDGFYGENIPDRTYHLNKFSNGYMGAASPGDISTESWELLQRATSVFSLAYTRFSDLQQSEASAKEAVRQASLDRVRAEIASMRTTTDLEKITPLIWNELKTLGVPFIRCGVFIMDDAQQFIHTYLSTPEGKSIAAFHIPYSTPGNISQVISNWHNGKIYTDHWDESDFTVFAATLIQQGALASADQYLNTIPKGGFYLHFLPFLQGMLYVGNSTLLAEDEIKLTQLVADAFSTAYARYEDFNKLESAKEQIEITLVDLKQAQAQLVQSEKMASLGELTAGIAHEIQNPLNFVNNFSEVSTELLDEMIAELGKNNPADAMAIADDVKQNLEKILHHGKRADGIVKGMLQHSRSSSGIKEPTNINTLADEYLRLAYHGLRAKDKSFNAILKTDYDETIGDINIIPQDIGRAVLNLITNAFYAVGEKKKQTGDGFEPTVSVSTKRAGDSIEVNVKDNGNGIPQKVLDKIFQPFFTTKPTGQGTGLGLSLSYDIVKAHGGEIRIETKEGEGTEFIISLRG